MEDASVPSNAEFMDGTTSKIWGVAASLHLGSRSDDSTLIVRSGDRIKARWSLSGLREKPGQADASKLIVSHEDMPEARLSIWDAELIGDIRGSAQNLKKREAAPGVFRKIAVWAGGALAAVLLIVFVIVPALSDQLAVLMPAESEEKLGDASVRQIGWVLSKFDEEPVKFCEAPAGRAALDKMLSRFTNNLDTPYNISLRVMNHKMENAFAVPGGRMVLFDGLIQKADSAEEIAGVLGHELGHVVHRDPTRLALRSAGTVGILGMLIGDFTGGAFVLLLTERLIAASYAQDAETNADTFAYGLMDRSGLPTTPFGNFFERMAKIVGDDEGVLSHLASHPNLSLRAKQARAADKYAGRSFTPVLTEEEWAALKDICSVTVEIDPED